MTRNSANSHFFLAVIGVLVIIGIIQTVRHNFLGLLIMVTLAAVFILLFKKFAANNSSQSGYEKALKQQRKKYAQQQYQYAQKQARNKSFAKKNLHKRSNRPHPFKVIEGQKGKKKNSGVQGEANKESDLLK